LQGIGEKLVAAMGQMCPSGALAGCPAGPAGTECAPCLPTCEVIDIENRGTGDEQRMKIPWCGHVCESGLCTEQDLSLCQRDHDGRCVCPDGLAPTQMSYEEHCAPLLYPEPPDRNRDTTLLSIIPRQEPTCSGTDCLGTTSVCWYVTDSVLCDHGAELRIVRGEDPPPRTFAVAKCAVADLTERDCENGLDDDEDCLIDSRDPDCGG
jgi:hypothetical protein